MYELFMRGMYLHFAHVKYKNIWNINTFMLRIHNTYGPGTNLFYIQVHKKI